MPKTDILKLIFHHDQRLDNLAPSNQPADDNPLAIFTQPDPTYSTLYFSGTDLENEQFGLNKLQQYEDVLVSFSEAFEGMKFTTQGGEKESFLQAVDDLHVNAAMVISNESVQPEIIHSFSQQILRDILEKGWIILFKREAQHGFDLHIFSKENIYTRFFYPLQKLIPESFRFFSINGKRLSSEEQFYFELNRLNKPPHGFEEVFPESVL